MAALTGWLALALVALAACVPIVQRAVRGRRAAPDSPTMRAHVVIGFALAAVAFVHTLMAVFALGDARATGGGMLALAPGALAFLVVLAHTGIGLQLRRPTLRGRAEKRRAHVTTAILIAAATTAHVVALLRAG